MPLPDRFARVLRDRRLPLRTRSDLLAAVARRRMRPRATYRVRWGDGAILLSHDDFDIDWKSLLFVAVDEPYRTDYDDALVLDLGAHKGYYGAYALARAARGVISFEPEDANLELLERSAATFRGRDTDWSVRRAAVGAVAGEAELHVMSASWGHALHPPDQFAEYEVATRPVRVEALADVLAEAGTLAASARRIVVKLNIEGEECSTVLGTPPAAWEPVSELFVETHPWADCGAAELEAHLSAAGLTRVESSHRVILRMRREGAARSDSRSGPT